MKYNSFKEMKDSTKTIDMNDKEAVEKAKQRHDAWREMIQQLREAFLCGNNSTGTDVLTEQETKQQENENT